MKITESDCSYHVTECDYKFGKNITLNGAKLIPLSVGEGIKEINNKEKLDFAIHYLQAERKGYSHDSTSNWAKVLDVAIDAMLVVSKCFEDDDISEVKR